MAFKFYCLKCGHSEYISGNQPRVCSNCGWHSGQDAKPILVQLIEGDPVPADAGQDDYKPTWKDMGFETEDEYLFAQSIANRDQDVVKLQSELDAARAENAKLRAALDNHGLWVDFNHLSKVLEDIRVANWLTVHARALGFTIGYFRHLQNILDGKED